MKVILSLVSCFLLSLFFIKTTFAQDLPSSYITIVNPVRGSDFFQLPAQKPVTNVRSQLSEIEKRSLPATWLIRPDALDDTGVVNLLKSTPPNQELGLFMEVTPTWTEMAGVGYKKGISWHSAGSVFLTGYEVSERHKLIDSAFVKFKDTFGYFPKSVGAWWIDGNSLTYMKEKYDIVTNMDVADQYSTDNYQVWGQFFSTPFYPAKRNALVPATGPQQKIGVVTIQWASRDPFNSFGNGVLDSTFSVQANDYANKKYHDLNLDYFRKLLSIYLNNPYGSVKQVTIGLENDFSWNEFGGEFSKQLDEVSARQRGGNLVLTMSQFGGIYSQLPLTPSQIIFTDDPLGSGGKVLWFQNLNYRVGWFYNQKGSVIRDLRLLRESIDEPCLQKACQNLDLAMTETKNLDEVTFGDSWVIDEGKIKDVRINKLIDGVQISYKSSAGVQRSIKFTQNDVIIDNSPLTIQSAIAQAISNSENIQKIKSSFSYQLKDGFVKVILDQLNSLIIFTIFSVVFFYLPGILLLRKWNLSDNTKFILSWPVGLSIFTLIAFLLGYLHLKWGIIILPIVSLIIIRRKLVRPKIYWNKETLIGMLVIILGLLSWLSTMVKNGLVYDYGLGFWGANGHDALWHLSLIESLKNGLPPENPIFAGVNLNNYHYFFDLLLSQISWLTKISAVDLYFRFIPILSSLLIGMVAYILAREWFKSKTAARLAVFFIYFGGSFGWLVSYFKDKSLGGETLFWAQQGISTLINPPFAISILIFLTGLFLFLQIVKQKKYQIWLIVPLLILWGTLIEFKVYGGVLVLGALALTTIGELVKRNSAFLKVSLPVVLLSGLVFLPNNLGAGSLIMFSPLWLIHSMVDSADRLNWLRLSLARTAGLESENWFKFIGSEIIGLIIFILGNLGTRLLGFLAIKSIWSFSLSNIFIVTFLSLAFLIPLLFIQKGAAFNIVQFFYYFLLIFNFLAAVVLAGFIRRFKMGWVIVVVVILLTISTTWDGLHHYLPERPPARISNKELDALLFLKEQPKGTVLSYYFDKKLKQKYEAPVPLFAYESTSYIGAFSGKSEFIADSINLEILGIDYKGRLQVQKDVFAQKEPEIIKKYLKDNNIKYIYALKLADFTPDEEKYGVKKIFGNDEVVIYKVM